MDSKCISEDISSFFTVLGDEVLTKYEYDGIEGASFDDVQGYMNRIERFSLTLISLYRIDQEKLMELMSDEISPYLYRAEESQVNQAA